MKFSVINKSLNKSMVLRNMMLTFMLMYNPGGEGEGCLDIVKTNNQIDVVDFGNNIVNCDK